MDIETTKLELMQLLLNTQKEQVLARIKDVFEQEQNLWEELSEVEKSAIEKGLNQIENGKVKSHTEVMSKFRERYSS